MESNGEVEKPPADSPTEEQLKQKFDPQLVENVSKSVDEGLEKAAAAKANMSPFARRRLSDQIFSTFDAVRKHLSDIGAAEREIFIPTDSDVDRKPSETDVHHEISSGIAISLLASSRIALNWLSYEPKPVEAAITEANKLQAEIDTQDKRNLQIDDLFTRNNLWGGLAPLSAEPDLLELLKEPLPKHVLKSRQRTAVEALPDADEHIQIAAIVRQALVRLKALCGPDSQILRFQIRDWERWMPHVRTASLDDVAGMKSVYDNVLIPDRTLLQLISTYPDVAKDAKKLICKRGGFLHLPNQKELEWMVDEGVTAVLENSQKANDEENNRLLGYYSVVANTKEVKKILSQFCGYEDGVLYHAKNLPKKTQGGQPIQWLKKADAIDLLNAVEKAACTIELAVLPASGNINLPNWGAAAALKHAVHKRIANETGKVMVFTRYFEILEVNGQRVKHVENLPSHRFIEELGGRMIGTVEESFTRENVGQIRVLWYNWVSDLTETIESIEGKRQSEE